MWPGFREALLAVTPGRFHRGASIAIAGVIAVYLAMLLDSRQAYWALVTIYILSLPNVGMTWGKAIQRACATLVGAVLALVIVATFPALPLMQLLCFSVITTLGLYLMMTVSTTPYAVFLAVLTMLMVSGDAYLNPDNTLTNAFARLEMVNVGILVATVVAWLLWPVKAEDRLADAMRSRLERVQIRLHGLVQTVTTRSSHAVALTDPTRNLLADQLELLQAASTESRAVGKHRGVILGLLSTIDRLASEATNLDEHFERLGPDALPESARGPVDDALKAAAAVFDELSGASDRPAGLTEATLDRVAAAATALRKEIDRLDSAELVSVLDTLERLCASSAQFRELDNWLNGDRDLEHSESETVFGEARLLRSPFDAFRHVNGPMLKVCIKSAIATSIMLLVTATMRWEALGSTAVVTCILVTQPTIGASWAKGLQRLAGAFVGAVLGLCFMAALAPNTNDVGLLLAAIAVTCIVSGWLIAGRWEISYSGLQVGIASAIVLAEFNYPNADLTPGISRVMGIAIGMVVSFLVMWLVWPVKASSQVLTSLADAARTLSDMLEYGLRDAAQEQKTRPLHGYRYHIAWALADAFRYRDEARYEKGLVPSGSAPALHLATDLQDLNMRVHAVVINRRENLPEDVPWRSEIVAVRSALEARLSDIANLLESGQPLPQIDLDARVEALSRIKWGHDGSSSARSATFAAAQAGYLANCAELIEKIEVDAIETRAIFG